LKQQYPLKNTIGRIIQLVSNLQLIVYYHQ